jgi:hypothetical protein
MNLTAKAVGNRKKRQGEKMQEDTNFVPGRRPAHSPRSARFVHFANKGLALVVADVRTMSNVLWIDCICINSIVVIENIF